LLRQLLLLYDNYRGQWEAARLYLLPSASSTHTRAPAISSMNDIEACRYCIQCSVPVGGRLLCYASPHRAICCYVAGVYSKLSTCYLYNSTPPALLADVCVVDLSCVLLPSSRISLVASARYRRCSFSHDIVAMCDWRSISRYRLIVIPTNFLFICTITCWPIRQPQAEGGLLITCAPRKDFGLKITTTFAFWR